MSDEIDPPRPLSLPARTHWNRLSKRLHNEGRWPAICQDSLATYCETLALYLRLQADVELHGTLVQGRSAQELVRNPSIIGLTSTRGDLIRLARLIPLAAPKAVDELGALIDTYLDE